MFLVRFRSVILTIRTSKQVLKRVFPNIENFRTFMSHSHIAHIGLYLPMFETVSVYIQIAVELFYESKKSQSRTTKIKRASPELRK